jgi:hypothetical protein
MKSEERSARTISSFEDLEVFKKAYRVSLQIHEASLAFPVHEQQRGMADQLRVWLRCCLDLGYIEEAQWYTWRKIYQDIAKMLSGLHKNWG